MTSKMRDTLKPYAIVVLATLAIVLIYLKCYGTGDSLFISIDLDKPVDRFISRLIQESEAGDQFSFSICDYNIQNAVVFFLCKITGNIYQGVNAYYILSFFLISISTFWYLQKMNVSIGMAVFGAVMASLVPFHIDRGEGQIVTSTFFMVPMFCGLWYDIIYEAKVKNIKKISVISMCIAPFIDLRLSVMAGILMVILAAHRRKKEIIRTTIIFLIPLISATFLLNHVTSALHTDNLEQGMELAREEGMRIIDMIMPLRYHVWDRLWNLRYEYDVAFSANGESGLNSMGIILTSFLMISMIILFFNIDIDERISWIAWVDILVVLIANVSGFNLLFEYIGIHVGYWNRMAIFIIIQTIAVMGILADRLRERMRSKVHVSIINSIYLLIGLIGIAELLLRQNML